MRRGALAVLFLAALPALLPAGDGQQMFAPLGDFKLESGAIIRDCRVGYRTFGRMAGDRSNVVLVPTWFAGTSAELAPLAGPGRLLDTAKYHVVIVDCLANGVSTSPSNSPRQPRLKFPEITIRDMVASQHRLLTEVLHVSRLKAVVGISMGGMQVFEWMASRPGLMDKAVPIVGSPRLAPYDLLLWQTEIEAIRGDRGFKGGRYARQPARPVLYGLTELLFTTPERYSGGTRREEVVSSFARGAQAQTFDANDRIRQAEAMMAHDVSSAFGGSLERAAAAVRARALVVVSKGDRVVSPGPALEFARLIGAEVIELQGDCGHVAFQCEADALAAQVNAFLDQ